MPSAAVPLLDEALDLFPHAQPYDIQRDFMAAMLQIIGKQRGSIGLMESPTGTGKTSSLLSAALAWQRSSSAYGTAANEDNNNISSVQEPEWIKQARRSHQECIPVGSSNRRKRTKLDDEVDRMLRHPAAAIKLRPVRRIVFCSRTHSQLSQVMGEVERIVGRRPDRFPAGWQAVALAGRKSLCLHPQVLKASGGSQEALNERCLELQATPPSGCPFLPASGLGDLERALGGLTIVDVEEAVREGRAVGCCSYYGSREAAGSAALLTLPYASLFQAEAREALGLTDLSGCLVIVDEAHNLGETLNELASCSLELPRLAQLVEALRRYADRYGGRLSPINRQHVTTLLRCLSELHNQATKQATDGEEKVVEIAGLLQSCGIDQVNVHALAAYVREAHLSPKILSASDTPLLGPASLSEAVRLLTALFSASSLAVDGRLLLSPLRLRFISLNPASLMDEIVQQAHAVILAGGTMQPVECFFLTILSRRRIWWRCSFPATWSVSLAVAI